MPKIFHFFSTLLHTIDKTMEKKSKHRWTDHVSEAQHKRQEPVIKNKDSNGTSDIPHSQ